MNELKNMCAYPCPNCNGTDRLEFIPMLEGAVYAQCPCGYGWDLEFESKPELVN